MDAIERNSIFQALDEASMVKIDFHVGRRSRVSWGEAYARSLPGVMAHSSARTTPSCPSSSGSRWGATREARCRGDAEA